MPLLCPGRGRFNENREKIEIISKKSRFEKEIFVKSAKKGIEIKTPFVYNVCIAAFFCRRYRRAAAFPKGE